MITTQILTMPRPAQRLLPKLTPKLLRAVASRLMIEDQSTGGLGRWRPTPHQQELWDAACGQKRVTVLKARQLGASTAFCLHDLMLCVTRPGITVAILADTADRAKGLLHKCRRFAEQMPVEITESNTQVLGIRGVGGPESKILALTAGSALGKESRAGRGGTVHHIHSTESALHAQGGFAALAAVRGALVPSGSIIQESTAHPAGAQFRAACDSPEWEHLFFGVESNASYVSDPNGITDSEWVSLQAEYGFRSRPHAAWWIRVLRGDFGGAVDRCLREFPVLPEHPWTVAEGRWFDDWAAYGELPVLRTMPQGLHIHAEPDPAQKYSAAVDVAAGKGRDKSVVVVQDWRGEIVASWSSNLATMERTKAVILEMQTQYTTQHVLVEENGVGAGLVQMDVPGIWAVTTTKTSKHMGLERVKYRQWAGLPKEMKPEVEGLYIQAGEFHGPKDYAMALGFGLLHLASIPPPRQIFTPDQFRRVQRPRRGQFGTYG